MALGDLLVGGYNVYKNIKNYKKPISSDRTPFSNRTPTPQPLTSDVVPPEYDMQPPRPTSTTSTYQAPQNPVYQSEPMKNPLTGIGTIPGYVKNAGPNELMQARNTADYNLGISSSAKTQDIFDTYKNTMGEIKFKDLQARGEFTNAQQVTDNIAKVQKNITEGVINPQDIAKNTGMTVEQVNRIMGGRAFQDLQLSSTPGVQRERFTQDYYNNLQDLNKTQTRSEEDIQIKQQRLTDQLKTDTEDIQRKLDLTMGANEKMGALTGQSRSSLYQAGLMNIQQDAERTIGEATKQWANQTEDITRLKNRILEDYSQNATRLKQQYDRGSSDMMIQGLSLIQDYTNKYGLSTEIFKKAMVDLTGAIANEREKIAVTYMKGMNDYANTQKDYRKMLQDYNKEQNEMKVVGDLVWYQGKRVNPQEMYKEQQGLESITTQEIGGHNVTLQASALQGLSSVDQALFSAGLGNIRLGATETSSTRDQAKTIEKMAIRYGITYNANNPNETAQALRTAGHQVADVGKSLHERGLAVDIYPNHDYIKKVKPYMEAQGWVQTNPSNDAGHFEFQGGEQQGGEEPGQAEIDLYIGGPKNIKKGGLTKERYNEVKKYVNDNFTGPDLVAMLSEQKQNFVYKISNDFEDNSNKLFRKVAQGKNFSDGFDINSENPSDDISLIYAFAKVNDPDSAVRNEEYESIQKYNQTWKDKFGFDAMRTITEAQILTPEARKNMIGTLNKLYEAKEKSYTVDYNNSERQIQTFAGKGITGVLNDLRIQTIPTQAPQQGPTDPRAEFMKIFQRTP